MRKLLLLIAMLLTTQAFAKYDFANVKFLSVTDGDTFKVKIPSLHPIFGESVKVRIAKIDTPELRSKSKWEKALAYEAKAFTLNKLEKAKKIRLFNCLGLDSFGRIICDVSSSKTDNLGQDLINAGLAEVYEK